MGELDLRPLALHRVGDRAREQPGLDLALDQVVLRALLHGADGELLVPPPGEHDDRYVERRGPQLVERIQAVRVGKGEVEQHAVVHGGEQRVDRVARAPGP